MISQLDRKYRAKPACRGRVLLVDNDSDLLDLGLRALGEAGFQVRGALDAHGCLAALRREVPDLLLLDIHLPDISGLELCTLLKADPTMAGLRIVHLSGDGLSSEEQADALQAGADGYLARPLSGDDLVARVQAMLRVKRTEVELRRVSEELRAAERLVEQNEQRYKSLFEHNPDAVCSLDLDGRILSLNAACETLTGYSAAELFYAPFQRLLPPEERTPGEEDFLRSLHPTHGEPASIELPIIRRDGARRWAKITSLPIKVNGRIAGVFCVAQDITEQRESEARYRQVLHALPAAVYTCDIEGRITFFNQAAARLWGREPQLALDLWCGSWRIFELSGEPLPVEECPMTVTMRTGQPVRGREIIMERPDGTRSYVLPHPDLIRDSSGAVVGAVNVLVDLTEKRQIEAQFLRAQRMESIGTLAGGIAHDLNNTLSPIVMAIELLKLTCTDPASARVLETIETSARRGAEMVKQVLSFARGVEGERVCVQPRHLLKDLLKITKETFPKNIATRLTTPPDLWNLVGDPTQLHQVLLNLCLNARDAMPGGGRLSITAENVVHDAPYAAMNLEVKAGPYVVIKVQDSGTGVPAALMEKIFDPFFTTKEIGKGTGLGLSTSLAIVKSHGGFIRVSSETGQGAHFQVHLPADPRTMPPLADKGVSSLPKGHGEWILVVDDEASIRMIVQQTLEAFGYRVLLASDGIEAVAIYVQQAEKIAAVICDLMMPLMDGPSLIEVIGQMNPQARIIVASGLNESRLANPCVKDLLPKPYTAESLLQVLARVLGEGPDRVTETLAEASCQWEVTDHPNPRA